MCVLSCFSRAWLFATLWTVAWQAPLSMGFSRQEYWSGLLFLLQGIFLTQGLNPGLLRFLHWQMGSLPLVPLGKPPRGKMDVESGKKMWWSNAGGWPFTSQGLTQKRSFHPSLPRGNQPWLLTLDLWFPPSTTVSPYNASWLSHPSCGALLWQPEPTNTVSTRFPSEVMKSLDLVRGGGCTMWWMY